MSRTQKQGYSPLLPYIVSLGDFLVINCAFILFFMWYSDDSFQAVINNYTRILVCWNAGYFLARVQTSYYAYKRFSSPGRLVRSLVMHYMIFIVLFMGLSVLLTSQSEIMVIPMMFLLPILLVLIIIMRLSARALVSWYRKKGRNSRNMVLIGNTASIRQLFESTYNNPYTGLHVVGYFAVEPMDDEPEGLNYLGHTNDAMQWLENTDKHIHRVYSQVKEQFQPEEHALMNFCESHVIQFYVIPSVSQFVHRSLSFETLDEIPMLSIRTEPLTDDLNRFMKRSFDLIFSLVGLCILFPISFIIVFIGSIFNKSAIFNCQKRTGLNNKPFTCYTFSSYHSKEKESFPHGNVPYRMRDRNKWEQFLHHSHIDVVPQFWNVFKGDMSIVGPRPHLVDNTELYSDVVDRYLLRSYVKPGITGWSQVHGFKDEIKSLAHIARRVKQDVWYIEHWGMFLDLRIIAMTCAFLLKK